MKHIDARDALDNEYLMQVFEERMEVALSTIEGAAPDDDRMRFQGAVERRLLKSILDTLEEACKVHY